jgi:predicted SpoU family rRNA methylase
MHELIARLFKKALRKIRLTTRRANTLRKIGSENLTLRDDHAHEIASRIQNTRTTHFETDFKTSARSWETERRLFPKDLTRETR